MPTLKGTPVHRSTTALADAASSTSDVLPLGSIVVGTQEGAYGVIRGFVNSNLDGLFEIYFAMLAADLTTLPAAGVNDNALRRVPASLTGGGAGISFTQAIVAPFARVRFTNQGGATQTTFRFHVELAE